MLKVKLGLMVNIVMLYPVKVSVKVELSPLFSSIVLEAISKEVYVGSYGPMV